jgi:hypothetical protein
MPLSRVLFSLLALALAGCASRTEIEQRNAIEDDAKCQSYGAKLGEPAYVQCRAQLDAARTGARAAAMSGAAAPPGGGPVQVQPMPQYQPQPSGGLWHPGRF